MLDIGGLRPHIMSMFGHQKNVWRVFLLLGLVVLFVGMGTAWAEDNVELLKQIIQPGAAPLDYPFLSPDPSQRAFLINSFKFQHVLFAGISGASGTLVAFHYLALLAALIGALLIVFFPKYRKLPVFLSWLLVVIITVFAPYGSSFIFQPVKSEDASKACGPSTDVVCGFTPQLLAINLASSLQVLFSDAFNSLGWHGIIDELNAESMLDSQATFVAQPGWYDDADAYYRDCQESPLNKDAAEAPPAAAKVHRPKTFGDVWKEGYLASANAKVNQKPPPIMVLYDESDTEFMNTLKSTKLVDQYSAGLRAIYDTYMGKDTDVQMNGVAPAINYTTALKDLADTKDPDGYGFFQTIDDTTSILYPGFIFMRGEDAASVKEAAINSATDQQKIRKCYVARDPENRSGDLMKAKTFPECQDDGYSVYNIDRQANVIQYLQKGMENGGLVKQDKTGVPLSKLAGIYKQIEGMPVGNIRVYAVDTINNVSTVSAAKTCDDRAKELVDNAIKQTIENLEGDPLTKYADMLRGKTEINYDLSRAGSTGLIPSDILSDHADAESRMLGGAIISELNPKLRERYIGVNKIAGKLTKEEKQNIAMKLFLNRVHNSGQKIANATQSDEVLAKAAAEGKTIAVDGGFTPLTVVGGGLATFFGKVLLHVGAFFTGPLAQAIVSFISITVDMVLLVVIVLTPFLLLVGTLMPAAAAGILTLVIMSTFILKFVPITLIILNNIGGLIFDLLNISDSNDASTMKAMLVIAMGGIYGSLVGMTFFLMFKLGDPAAILGRMTAIDSSAKQIADKGMGAAIAAATAVGLLGAGAVGGATGWWSTRGVARKAAEKLGVPREAIDAVEGIAGANRNGATAGSAVTNVPVEKRPTHEDGKPFTDEEMALLQTPEGRQAMDSLMGNWSLNENDAARLWMDGKVRTQNGRMFAMDENDGSVSQIFNEGQFAEIAPKTQNVAGDISLPGQDDSGSGPSVIGGGTGPTGNNDGSGGEAVAKVPGETPGIPADATDVNAEVTKPVTTTPTPGTGTATTTTIASGADPVKVMVVGGELGKVSEVGSVGLQETANATETEISKRVKSKENDQISDEIVAEKKSINDAVNKAANDKNISNEARAGLQQSLQKSMEEANNIRTAEDLDKWKKKNNLILAQSGVSRESLRGSQDQAMNLNQQIGREIMRVDGLMAEEGVGEDRMKLLKDYKEKLMKLDTASMIQGEMATSLQEVESQFRNARSAMDAIGAADKMPTLGKTIWSGVYGSASGLLGGGGKIPIIGPALGEVFNEFYQAPERARAWNAAGGGMKWWEAQGNAQRMGFYQKEMAPLAAGHQYESMAAGNAFQAQADLARQSATEAVARSRSQFEALVTHNRGKMDNKNINVESLDFQNYMSVKELAGLGRIDAIDKVASVRQEAFLMQDKPLVVQRVKGGLDGALLKLEKGSEIEGKFSIEMEDANMALTPEMLNKFRGDLATKRMAGTFDEMMITHYGLAEKQYLRGDAEWNMSRYMNSNAASAAAFARKDVSTDYLIGGHLKMVQGKERFLEGKGQYETLVSFRNQDNTLMAKRFARDFGENLQEAVNKLDISPDKFKFSDGRAMIGVDLQVQQRLQIEKKLAEQLTKEGVTMPLKAVYDEAGSSGAAKYLDRAAVALWNIANKEAERQEKQARASSDYLQAQVPQAKNIDRAFNFDINGRKLRTAQAGEQIMKGFLEGLNTALVKDGKTFLGRETEFAKAMSSVMQKHTDMINADDNKLKGDQRQAWIRINKDRVENLRKEIEALDDGKAMWDHLVKMSQSDRGKYRMKANGDLEFALLSATSDYGAKP